MQLITKHFIVQKCGRMSYRTDTASIMYKNGEIGCQLLCRNGRQWSSKRLPDKIRWKYIVIVIISDFYRIDKDTAWYNHTFKGASELRDIVGSLFRNGIADNYKELLSNDKAL